MIIRCKECGKVPSQIPEFVELGKQMNCTPQEAVIEEEGTYNDFSGRFWCTECYIKIGMPLGKA